MATFPPVLAIAPFCAVWRALATAELRRDPEVVLRRDAVDLRPFEPVRRELDRAFPDEALLPVDLLVLELVFDVLLLEDRVVCAIVIAFLDFIAGCAIRAGGGFSLPGPLGV